MAKLIELEASMEELPEDGSTRTRNSFHAKPQHPAEHDQAEKDENLDDEQMPVLQICQRN